MECRTWTAGCLLSPACLKIPQTVLNHRKTGSVESQLFSGMKSEQRGLSFYQPYDKMIVTKEERRDHPLGYVR